MNQDTVTGILFILFVLCGIGLVLIVVWLIQQNAKNRISGRVDSFMGVPEELDQTFSEADQAAPYLSSERFASLRGKINRAFAVFSTYKLQQKISSAYWPISDVEFIFIRVGATVLGFIIGTIIPHSIIGGFGLGVFCFLIPGFFLDRAITNRQKRFQDQLLDFLVLIKGAVLAGFSLHQALEMAIKESVVPISEEFGRVLREMRIGIPLDHALINLKDRMKSDDLQLVVTAIVINSQVGGNLSTILAAAIDTIRERIYLFGEIRSLSSYSRYVGTFLSLLPFIAALIIFLLDPGYFAHVIDSIIVQIIFIVAFISIVIGNILIQRIVRIRL